MQKEVTLNDAVRTLYEGTRKADMSADEHDRMKEIYEGVMGLINPKPAPAPEV